MSEFSVQVKTSNGEKCDVIVTNDTTVADLKRKVIDKMSLANISVEQIRLIYKGKVLKDDNSLQSYDVIEGGAIHMVKAAQPVAPTPAPASAQASAQASPPFGSTPVSRSPAMALTGMGDMMNGMTPEGISQMMSNPMVEQMLSNPDLMMSLMSSNPQLQAILDANPHIRQVMSDPSYMRQTMQMLRNPNAMREAMRHQDMAISQLENHPEGFNALRRMYEDVAEPMMDASAGLGLGLTSVPSTSTTTTTPPSSSASPNNAALPNPWGPPSTPTAPPMQMPGFGMPGIGTPGMGAGMGMNPTQLSAMMSNPMFQQQMAQMMQNPQMMQQMAAMNPQMAQMMQNPQMMQQVQAMMSNPQLMQQMMNPANLQAMMNMQTSMQQLQSSGLIPGGMPGLMPGGMTGQQGLDFSGLFGSPAAPTIPVGALAPTADPAVTYVSQLQQLQDMGFTDAARNLQALVQTNGNVNAAIERLLGSM